MLWQVVMSVVLMTSSIGCAAKHIPLPSPVYGQDIVKIKINADSYSKVTIDSKDFDGWFFSKFYTDSYLQWKCKDMGQC